MVAPAPASEFVHRRFGDRTCGALATVICGAGLRFTTVDEMVTEFMDALLNRTPCVDSKSECNWISQQIQTRWISVDIGWRWVMRAEGAAVPISLSFPIVDVLGGDGVKNHANVSTWIKNSTAQLLAKIF